MRTESKSPLTILSETSLLPISMVSALLGLAYFVTTVANQTTSNTQRLDYQRDQRAHWETLVTENMERNARSLSELKATSSATDAKVDILLDYFKRRETVPGH